MNSTITAVATGGGKGAIAVIRVSGPKSLEAFKTLTRKSVIPKPNTLLPYWIYQGQDKLDQSMMVYFRAPNSFTGEDVLEIHCHGSEVVKNQILELLFKIGIKPAKPGEFSERAYYNGKIDVTQAEAIMELVSAENSQLAKLATRQLAGEFSNKIKKISKKLIRLNSTIVADLDFSEEDLPVVSLPVIKKQLQESIRSIQNIQQNSELLPKLKNGIHVALVGLPNAGKSTLLNTILGYDRSIVTNIAGTTRDTISESVEINGLNYVFTDTAGLNIDADQIEKIGIERTAQAIKSADIVLILIEPGKLKETEEYITNNQLIDKSMNQNIVYVYTKADLYKMPSKVDGVVISAKKNQGISKLIKVIADISKLDLSGDINILTERQQKLLQKAELNLIDLIDNIEAMSFDLISAELERTINHLNELTGEQANQQIIDSIFRNFCIGK